MSKIFNIILTVGLFGLSIYLLLVERIELPSRTGAEPSILTPPVTFFMAMLPIAFGVSLVLYEIDRVKYKKLCSVIVTVGVLSLFIAMVIIAPLLKSIG